MVALLVIPGLRERKRQEGSGWVFCLVGQRNGKVFGVCNLIGFLRKLWEVEWWSVFGVELGPV